MARLGARQPPAVGVLRLLQEILQVAQRRGHLRSVAAVAPSSKRYAVQIFAFDRTNGIRRPAPTGLRQPAFFEQSMIDT